MAHDVFISYSKMDKPTADAACAALEVVGIRCWIAPRDVTAGTNWGGSIIRAIGASRVMVLVFSSHSNNSQQVLREVERAVNKGVVIVPFRIEDIKPSDDMEYYLSAPHWLDALTPPLETHLQRLCRTVRAIVPTLDDDTAMPAAQSRLEAARTLVSGARSRVARELDSSARKENLCERSFNAWKWRGKHGLLAATGITLFLVVASIVAFVFWPRNRAGATLAESPGLATSAIAPRSQPVESQRATKSANSYDALATGKWVQLVASPEDLIRLLAQKAYIGRKPTFDRGTLELHALGGGLSALRFPEIKAQNIIIRAQVRKRTLRGTNLVLGVRCTENNSYGVMFDAQRNFAIGRIHSQKWRDAKWEHLTSCSLPENYQERFFEFAFAAVDDKLTAYVDGQKILQVSVPIPETAGTVRVAVFAAEALFQHVEIQILDKPPANATLATVAGGRTESPTYSPAPLGETQDQSIQFEPKGAKKRASDYDQLATGNWLAALPSQEEFKRLRSEKAYLRAEPRFVDGILECNGGELNFPPLLAKDAIIRAQVNKMDANNLPGVNLTLTLRRSGANSLGAWCNGSGWFGVGESREGRPWRDLKTCQLPGLYNGRFFEFAFAAVGNDLTVYVDGRKILEARDDEITEDRAAIGVGARCRALFRDIEVQILDK
jgi:hypothetical protein